MRRRLLIGALAAAPTFVWAGAACDDVSHQDIGDEINILVRRDNQLVPPATERLAAYQRRAIPQIETAMHTAAPRDACTWSLRSSAATRCSRPVGAAMCSAVSIWGTARRW